MNVFKSVHNNTTPGADAIPTDVFKRGSARLFSLMLKHTHLSQELMKVTLLPIRKCKMLSAADSQNYRPIALQRSASKLLETILQHRMKEFLCASHAQFGYKEKQGTEMTTFTHKETVKQP